MALDKSWMSIVDRRKTEYQEGVEAFLDFAFANTTNMETIRCPCVKCRNVEFKDRDEVLHHLLRFGVVQSYTKWVHHGENYEDENPSESYGESGIPPYDDMMGLINDLQGGPDVGDTTTRPHTEEEPFGESARFYTLLQDAKKMLYDGCEHSILGVIVKLLHLKTLHRWSNTAFNHLLEFLQQIIPNGKETLPKSFYHAHKYISELGLDYIKYDVCKNNCVVYWDVNANLQSCPVCGSSRWQVAKRSDGGKAIPHKVLRYFPIKNRLQRLFMSTKTASDMRWHKEKRVDDGVMRHPADTPAWKSFDILNPDFASDPRNVRLGLATDGFQPFGAMSSQHSLWPVILMPFNNPPWRCMKQPYFMMALLIPGPHSPGMGIDVFLEPLIKELKELWDNGCQTYDVHAKQNFCLRAAVLWTINDFPAYGDLSGWATKGYMACPLCHKDTTSRRLHGSRKICFMGHRRFLPMSHKWRKEAMLFDGTIETRRRPVPMTADEVLCEVQSFRQAPFGRGIKRKYDSSNSFNNWRKKSVFFDLPYWKTLLVRHNLDVMHIEKNVCDNIIGTLMNIKGKTKDTLGSRYDLVNMGIRPELHPQPHGDQVHFSAARYVLSNSEKEALCNMLIGLKTPDGFLSNISRCVNEKERKLSGMKSHDCHVFMQRLLPIAIRGFLPKEVCEPLIELSAFFRDLCCKSIDPIDMDRLQNNIVLTLCKLEMIFPPSFFDVMIHLVIHLTEEAKLAGPVQYRWMFPIERYLRTLKSYVRNKARPEGSIAEAYIVDECLTFCSRYLEGVETRFNRAARYADNQEPVDDHNGLGVFALLGRPIGSPKYMRMSEEMHLKAQLYVLNNCPEVSPYVEKYKSTLPNMSRAEFLRRYNSEFVEWFKQHVEQLHSQCLVRDDLLALAMGPSINCKQYHGYDVNGFRFHTMARGESRRTQSCGVLCKGDNVDVDKEYYGNVEEILELQYREYHLVTLFKCQWYDVRHRGTGYRVDRYGITSVNLTRTLQTEEPFILAYQAEQVFYVGELKDNNWAIVLKTQPRDLYAMPSACSNDIEVIPVIDEVFQGDEKDESGRIPRPLDDVDDLTRLDRPEVEAAIEPISTAQEIEERIMRDVLVESDFIDDNEISGNDAEYDSEGSEYDSAMSDD